MTTLEVTVDAEAIAEAMDVGSDSAVAVLRAYLNRLNWREPRCSYDGLHERLRPDERDMLRVLADGKITAAKHTEDNRPTWKDVGIRWGRLQLSLGSSDYDRERQTFHLKEWREDMSGCAVLADFERGKEGYSMRTVGDRPWDSDQPALHFSRFCMGVLKLYFELTRED